MKKRMNLVATASTFGGGLNVVAVSVTDDSGDPVEGLSKGHFHLTALSWPGSWIGKQSLTFKDVSMPVPGFYAFNLNDEKGNGLSPGHYTIAIAMSGNAPGSGPLTQQITGQTLVTLLALQNLPPIS